MGIVIKQATSNTIYSYIGAALGFVTVWYVNRELLTTEQNGLLNLLVSITVITGSLSNLGMAGVTIRMFPHFRNKEKAHNGFLFYPLIVTVIGFILFLVLFFLFRDELTARNIEKSRLFADNLFYLIPLTFFTALFNIFDAYSRSIYLTSAGVIIKEVMLRIMILVAAFLYFRQVISFDVFVLAYCGTTCSIAIFLGIYLYARNELHIAPAKDFLTTDMRREMRYVAIYSIITGLSSLLISSIDKIIVNDKLGLAAAGVFAIATYFGSIIQIPARSIIRVTSPVLADAWKADDLQKIMMIYHKTCINQLVIGGFLFLCIWVNIDPIMHLLPASYAEGKYVIFFMGLAYLIDMATGVNGAIIATSKYFRYDTYFMLFLVVVTFATNIALIPIYGIAGAALASCITYFLFNLLRYLFIWKKFNMQPYDRSFVKVIITGLALYIICRLIPSISFTNNPDHNSYLNIILRGTFVTLIFSFIVYQLKITPELNNTVRKFIGKAPRN